MVFYNAELIELVFDLCIRIHTWFSDKSLIWISFKNYYI